MMHVEVYSIPMTDEERAKWPSPTEICGGCRKAFGSRKMERLDDGTVVHRNCDRPYFGGER